MPASCAPDGGGAEGWMKGKAKSLVVGSWGGGEFASRKRKFQLSIILGKGCLVMGNSPGGQVGDRDWEQRRSSGRDPSLPSDG